MATGKALPQIKAVKGEGLPLSRGEQRSRLLPGRQTWRAPTGWRPGEVPATEWQGKVALVRESLGEAEPWLGCLRKVRKNKGFSPKFLQSYLERKKEHEAEIIKQLMRTQASSLWCITGTIDRLKRQPKEWEEIFAHLYIWWGANAQDMSRNPTSQQQTHKFSIKTWEKDLKRHFYQYKQMIKKHVKRCSIPLVNREMQIKATTGYHLIPIRIATIKIIIIIK